MPLQLITGRANAGKTGAVNARLLESLERGESPVLLLPSVVDARRAVSEFANKAPVGLEISTLSRWADAMWRLHGDGRRIVGASLRDALVRRAIAEKAPRALGDVTTTPGFARMVAGTVAVMAGEPKLDGTWTDAMHGVAQVCARYYVLLDAVGCVESAETRRRLGELPPKLDGVVAVNRFLDLDEPTICLLTGLARSNDVVMALTWEEGFAPTKALDQTAHRLLAVADQTAHAREPVPVDEIGQLANRLYASGSRISSRDAVQLGLAAGSEAQAAMVAQFASQAVAQGTLPDRVVVAFPRLDLVSHRLEQAFAAEGLACDVDVARPVAATALGRSLSGLLTLCTGAGDRTTAMGVLLGPHSDVPRETVDLIDREWRRGRISESDRLLEGVCGQEQTSIGRAAQLGRKLAAVAVSPESAPDWEKLVYLLMTAAAAGSAKRGRTSAREVASDLSADASAVRAIVRAVGEMASVEGAPFSAEDVRAALQTIVAGGTSGERPGRVQVTELARLGSRRFDTVILAGLTASEFATGDPDSLADELRLRFADETEAGAEDVARLEFYHAISRARSQLVLVRRDADDGGAPLRPSVLWEEVVDAYREPDEVEEEWPLAGPPCARMGADRIARTAPVFTYGRRELRERAGSGAWAAPAGSKGQVADLIALENLSRTKVFSATEIETYLQCPYRWFYERIVRPEEIDVEVDARAVGSIAHKLLREFYAALPSGLGEARVTPENVTAARSLLDRVVAEADLGIAADGLADELSLGRAFRWVQRTVSDDAEILPGFVPTDHELAFGGPNGIEVMLGGVAFRGSIDRLDRSKSAVFVTDYKSSRKVSGYGAFAEEAKIQAVVYALAAQEVSGLAVAGSVYRSLRSRQMRGFWRPDLLGGPLAPGHEDDVIGHDEFEALVQEAATRVEGAVEGIRGGRIPREPATKPFCAFCPLGAQCEGAKR